MVTTIVIFIIHAFMHANFAIVCIFFPVTNIFFCLNTKKRVDESKQTLDPQLLLLIPNFYSWSSNFALYPQLLIRNLKFYSLVISNRFVTKVTPCRVTRLLKVSKITWLWLSSQEEDVSDLMWQGPLLN